MENLEKIIKNPVTWIGALVLLPGTLVFDVLLLISSIICYFTSFNKDYDKFEEKYKDVVIACSNEILALMSLIGKIIITVSFYLWIFM